MATRSRKKVSSMQTFDPEDFDLHALEHSIRSKVLPLKRGEKLARVNKDLRVFKGEEPLGRPLKKKSILVAVFGNILMPGLGNLYVHKSPFSLSILILSVLVMAVTFSPIFPIVNLLTAAHIAQPNLPEGATPVLVVPSSVMVNNESVLVGPTFSILIVPLLLAWLHLLYLLVGRSHKTEWSP